MSAVIPGQNTIDFARALIPDTPWWAECKISRTERRSDDGMTTRSPYMMTPLEMYRESPYLNSWEISASLVGRLCRRPSLIAVRNLDSTLSWKVASARSYQERLNADSVSFWIAAATSVSSFWE